MSKVALIKGSRRLQNITKALGLIEDEIAQKIEAAHQIVIKPNFVHTDIPLCATHIEAVKAVLDFIKHCRRLPSTITIAEGTYQVPTSDGFKNYGYYKELKNYPVKFVDLNTDDFQEVEVFDQDLKPLKVRVAKTMLNSDFRISVGPMKTHDTTIVTLSLKNIAVGSLIKDNFRDDKARIHEGYKAINKTIAKLAEIIPPHLSIIDGLVGMDGDGPAHGEAVQMDLALAGTDFLAVDTVGTYLMGFDPKDVGYLYWCQKNGLGEGDLSKIEIVGNTTLNECRKKFNPHPYYKEQLNWK